MYFFLFFLSEVQRTAGNWFYTVTSSSLVTISKCGNGGQFFSDSANTPVLGTVIGSEAKTMRKKRSPSPWREENNE